MARFDGGYFKLWRRILSSDIGANPDRLALTIHLFGMANLEGSWADGEGGPIKVSRGELVTSLKELSARTGLSISKIRTQIKYLVTRGTISTRHSTRGTFISVLNYGPYQDKPAYVSTPDDKHIANTSHYNEEGKKERRSSSRQIGSVVKQEARFRLAKEIAEFKPILAAMFDNVIPKTIERRITEILIACDGDVETAKTVLEDLYQSAKIRTGEGLVGNKSSYVAAAILNRFGLDGGAV